MVPLTYLQVVTPAVQWGLYIMPESLSNLQVLWPFHNWGRMGVTVLVMDDSYKRWPRKPLKVLGVKIFVPEYVTKCEPLLLDIQKNDILNDCEFKILCNSLAITDLKMQPFESLPQNALFNTKKTNTYKTH